MRRILFHISRVASTKQTPPGYKPQKKPNLHRQARRHRPLTHARPGGRRRRRGLTLLPSGSTEVAVTFFLVGRGFERNRPRHVPGVTRCRSFQVRVSYVFTPLWWIFFFFLILLFSFLLLISFISFFSYFCLYVHLFIFTFLLFYM